MGLLTDWGNGNTKIRKLIYHWCLIYTSLRLDVIAMMATGDKFTKWHKNQAFDLISWLEL